MTTTTWIVQEKLHSTAGYDTLDILRHACAEAGCAFITVPVTPASAGMPSLPSVSAPFVFYGYTTLITHAARSPQWRSGVFFDPDLFQPSIYANKYGALYLNPDIRTLTYREFCAEAHRNEDRFFIRPNNDLKSWTGEVMTFEEFKARCASITEVVSHERIAVSAPKTIYTEWRVVLVDGRPIASCQYQPQAVAWTPAEVEDFARNAAAKWCPFPVLVMDVARTDQGLRVIELNCFNGSNFYLMDVGRIVRNVSRYLEAR